MTIDRAQRVAQATAKRDNQRQAIIRDTKLTGAAAATNFHVRPCGPDLDTTLASPGSRYRLHAIVWPDGGIDYQRPTSVSAGYNPGA